jgi:phosphate uptake regulator
MKRRLVKQGEATLMISLPAKWLKERNLEKGSEIDLEESENSLLISSNGVLGKKETEINLTKLSESAIRTLITSTYRLGFDVIKVNFDSEDKYTILKETIKTKLIGFDITQKKETFCIVENITEPSEEQFDNIMEKIIYNIQELLESTKKRMTKEIKDFDYEEIEQRLIQYDNFCRRVVSKKKAPIKKSELFWTFISTFMRGQREIYHLNKYLDKEDATISKDTILFFDNCITVFDMLKKSYFKKEISLLEEIHELEEKIINKKMCELFKKNKDAIIVYYISSSIRNFYLSSSSLIGLLL